MFIRRAKIRTTERGDVYYSYRLVRNERGVNGGEIMYRRGGVKMYHGLGGSLSA